MRDNERVKLILVEIEKYLLFDGLQREYAAKGILVGLRKIALLEESAHD